MELTIKQLRKLQSLGFAIGGYSVPTNGIAIRLWRERSLNEHSCEITSYKPSWFWQIHCAHERLYLHPCPQCKRIGMTNAERLRRHAEFLASV